jgi:hypothetical protein
VPFGIIENVSSLINFFETSKFDYMNSGFVKGWCSSSSRGKWVAVNTSWHVVGLPMEEPLQICRVASDLLNKHSRTPDRGWFSGLGLEEILTTPRLKGLKSYETFHKASDLIAEACGCGSEPSRSIQGEEFFD